MKIHKVTPREMASFKHFIHASELVLERDKFGGCAAYENWKDLDDDDQAPFLKLRREIAEREGMNEEDVDDRILCYEYLRANYTNRLMLLFVTAEVLIDNTCDPQDEALAFRPDIQFMHVAPEQ